jgi:hypothetical protein
MGADYTLLRSGETSPSYFETTVNSHVSTTEIYLEKDFLGIWVLIIHYLGLEK